MSVVLGLHSPTRADTLQRLNEASATTALAPVSAVKHDGDTIVVSYRGNAHHSTVHPVAHLNAVAAAASSPQTPPIPRASSRSVASEPRRIPRKALDSDAGVLEVRVGDVCDSEPC